MFDIDLIHQTTEAVTGESLSRVALVAGMLALAATIFLGCAVPANRFGISPERYAKLAAKVSLPDEDPPSHPTLLWPVGVALLAVALGLYYRNVLLFTGPLVTAAVLCAALSLLWVWRDSSDVNITVLGRVAICCGVIVISVVIMCLQPMQPTTTTRPTEAASAELTRAEKVIENAVVSRYDVEILEDNTCWHSSILEYDEQLEDHLRRTEFVEQATSDDPGKAPSIRLLTSGGIVGCYQVLYDPGTDKARLIIDAEDTDLPAPGGLKKE